MIILKLLTQKYLIIKGVVKMNLLKKVFGNNKIPKSIIKTVNCIESLETSMLSLSAEALANKTLLFKDRLARGEVLETILPEAYAVLREVNNRVTGGKRHNRVQLIGGILLYQGCIAEMQNGEGKTQTALLPLYLRALEGKGAHLVTFNSYLAEYHSKLASEVFRNLAVSVGCVTENTPYYFRRKMYNSDVTYTTYTQVGFDYLRDNTAVSINSIVQRGLYYAVIDEADSILIDAARTPLSLARTVDQPHVLYKVADQFAKTLNKGRLASEPEKLIWDPIIHAELLEEGDFVVNEKAQTPSLTKKGVALAEKYFMVDNLENSDNKYLLYPILNAIKANFIEKLDTDYILSNENVVLVDTFTGRLNFGSRYSGGLHQAIEAKENVLINRESRTTAAITVQNLFNKYMLKSGMSGTIRTSEDEIRKVYNMEVVTVPTNKPMIREDLPDAVYRTEAAKYQAVVRDVQKCCEKGQPVIIGTVSIEKSELVSRLLNDAGVKHTILNAKYYEKEAAIIAQAGQKNAVTVVTNMAGRGTDIRLGEGVAELGGLKIIGTERHEARRIDNQLRGRSGRQGDPGESKFFISIEDSIIQRLAMKETLIKLLDMVGMDNDDEIENKMLTKAIENLQKKLEQYNLQQRVRLYEQDGVLNEQREYIYELRDEVLHTSDSNMVSVLRVIDEKWENQIFDLNRLWNDIQKDEPSNPVNEYIRLASIMFEDLKASIQIDTVKVRKSDAASALCSHAASVETLKQCNKISEQSKQSSSSLKLWRVSGESNVYLFGSIHAADETVYPLDARIEKAFEISKNLAIEANITDISDADQYRINDMSYIFGGKSIKDYISKNTFDAYSKLYEIIKPFLTPLGIRYWEYMHIMPWKAYMLLAQLSITGVEMPRSSDASSEIEDTDDKNFAESSESIDSLDGKFELGIDRYFINKAKTIQTRKNIIELESVIFQTKLLSSFSKELQDELLTVAVEQFFDDNDDIEPDEVSSYSLIKALWQNNDETILDCVDECVKDSPIISEFKDKLFIERNEAMTKRIEEYLSDAKKGDTFVVAGYGHMVGEAGIVELLKKNGYAVDDVNDWVVDGEGTGCGSCNYADGLYIGEFVDGVRQGKGKINFSNGNSYNGDWLDDKQTGFGTLYYKDGSKYIGDFVDGKSHGKGRITLVNGDFYDGDWNVGSRTGYGSYQWADGNTRYVGEFDNGILNGKGVFYYADGREYDGEFVNGKYHGIGKLVSPDGEVLYDGEWDNGKRIEVIL